MRAPKHIIVIGAGIAGLSAAWTLRQRGIAVTVLEAAAQAGGRIKSVNLHGHQIEVGAQFLSTGYRYLPPLLRAAGLDALVRPLSAQTVVQRDKRLFRLHGRRPWTPWSSGLLRGPEFLRLAVGMSRLGRLRGRDPSALTAFCELDQDEAETWCHSQFGAAATTHLLEPMVHGLYFHRLQGNSPALVAAMLCFAGHDSLSLAGGWQALPIALAAQLDVHYGVTVDSLQQTDQGIQACAADRCWTADAAILAVPAPVARQLLPAPGAVEEQLLGTRYAACLHLALGLAADWQPPPALQGCYGALMSPAAGSSIAALTLESGRALLPGNGEVISVMLGHAAATRLQEQSDAHIADVVLAELENWLPGIHAAVRCSHLQRWTAAEPLTPVGRARAVAHYRASLPEDRRIVLAGDYLGTPWTDGAAETGIWAANHICR